MSTQAPAQSLIPDWTTFCELTWEYPELGFSLDLSSSGVTPKSLKAQDPALQSALEAMARLEAGEIANPDENRMVGHYWLRSPELAPTAELTDRIESALARVEAFACDVHSGRVCTPDGVAFDTLLCVGIGGSALGPQLVQAALGRPDQPMEAHFLDNTDPEGIDSLLALLGPERLSSTMVLVTSKSGGTPETLNGMLEVEAAFEAAGRPFGWHAVAITGDGSKLYQRAAEQGWLEIFPMEDWVGGRTSVTSTVGLVPAALCGVDVRAFLDGAGRMDALTRRRQVQENPAALLSAAWYQIGEGRGRKDMVVLPYKDRLELFSRYLQQLVMESLGKALDRDGKRVEQGIAVYGNKGSTDQHAYVQQLRDGLRNFFVTFIAVDKVRGGSPFEIEEGIRTGDFLNAFFLGTRRALAEEGRPSITLTIPEVNAASLGALIALFERAVGLYAELININAYHQPGVEAGKKAASASLELQKRLLALLGEAKEPMAARELADQAGAKGQEQLVFYLCRHLANTGRLKRTGHGPESRFRALVV